MNNMPAEKLFQTYMDLISKRESEEIYRLNEPIGEGIMKHTHIAKGIELVYSELESYSPNYQTEKKEVDGLEIMYIVDGHGEFELQNRQFASGEKGDVMIFNCKTAVKKAILGKSGMNCISIILLIQKFRDKDGCDLRIKSDTPDAYFSGSTGRKVQNVRRIINSNLEKEISIEELAGKVNLNRTTLQKIFKKNEGVLPKDWRK